MPDNPHFFNSFAIDVAFRPLKRSLRSLSKEFLGEQIQDDEQRGHDSQEDAMCALRLVNCVCGLIKQSVLIA